MDVGGLLRNLMAYICQFLYQCISWLYELFMNISKVEILSADDIQPIYQRITMILAIIMVFYVTFEFVKFVVQPEGISDKDKGVGNIVQRMIIVVVLIAFVPTVFSLAYDIQNKIFDNQLFSKVILGKQNIEVGTYGRQFSANIFGMFYYVDDEEWKKLGKDPDADLDCDGLNCKQVVSLNLQTLAEEGKMPFLHKGIDETENVKIEQTEKKEKVWKINFDGIFAVLVGGVIVWILLLYCVDAGTRVAQLAFLQIIAPIPIIGYLAPKKDGIFQKWTKQCVTTYLDLFLRVGIIHFVLLICQILGDAYHNGTLINSATMATTTPKMKTFIYIALVLGLLAFAKRAPKMLKELFPSSNAASGDFGLKPGERPGVARAVGATLGATTGARTAVLRGISTARRNRNNNISGKRENAIKELDAKKRNLSTEREKMKNLRNQRNQMSRAEYRRQMAEQRRKVAEAKSDRDSALANRRNTRYQSVAASAFGGLAGGVVRGAIKGGQLNKIESFGDIRKQMKEVENAESKHVNEIDKWYDAGGGSLIDRTTAQAMKKIGLQTSAERMEQEVKNLESNVKEAERISESENSIIKRKDEIKDNDVKKMSEGKLKTTAKQATVIKFADGTTFEIKKDENVSTAYGRAIAQETTAQKELEEAIKNGKDVAVAEAKLASAKQRTAQIGKKIHEDIVLPQMLDAINKYKKDPNHNPNPREIDEFDQGSVSKVYETLWTIENARQNPETVSSMSNILGANSLAFQAFMGEQDIDKDTLDAIDKAIKRSTSERNEAIFRGKQQSQKIKASAAYDAHKADSGYGGNSSK